jgi:hypothetical protein
MRVVRVLAHATMATVVIGGSLVAAAAWRLSQGPVELPWVTGRIEAAINAGSEPTKLSIGSTALAWEGFSHGVDLPLDLRLTDVRVTGAGGQRQLELPRADVSLSMSGLLHGRLELRSILLQGPHLTLNRAADGRTSLDLGSLNEVADAPQAEEHAEPPGLEVEDLLREFAQPATDDRGRARGLLGQLRRVRITDARVDVIDRQLQATWHAPSARIDLTRRPAGGVDGSAVLTLALGQQTATLRANATLDAGRGRSHLQLSLTPVAPAALAGSSPRLSALAALDAPVALDASLNLDPSLVPEDGRLAVRIGSGTAGIGASRVPIKEAVVVLEGSSDEVRLRMAHLTLQGHEGGALTNIQLSGGMTRTNGRYDASLGLNLDQVAFSDLNRLWPEGVGGGARDWILQNITGGIARNGRLNLTINAGPDLTGMALTGASGTLDGNGLTVHWLRPVPPIEDGVAQLRLLDADTIEIAIASGRERVGRSGLALKGGMMRITGVSQRDQASTIQGDVTGSLADVIALLKEPRLELLDKHPVELRDPAGDAAIALNITLPLESKVQMADVGIHARAHLNGVHLGGLVAGRDLDHGMLDLDATADGLSVKGQAQIAGIGTQLDGAMDFRAGPPSQVVQRVTVIGRPGAGQLAAAGLDSGGTVFGQIPIRAVYSQRRAGDAEVAVEADFTPVTLVVPPIGWRKPIGAAAKGSATVRLAKDKLVGIDPIAIEGDDVSIRGSAAAIAGQLTSIRIDSGVFGRSDIRGTVLLSEGQPIQATLTGPSLDLAPRLAAKSPKRDKSGGEPPPGPSWVADARFDRVLLANDHTATGVVARIENDGRLTRTLHVVGQADGTSTFTADLVPNGRGRQLTVTAGDAGAVLGGLDVDRSMRSGTLTITGAYDDASTGFPLTGTAEIDNFRIHQAVGLAKLLQAMTLYGLVDVLRGSGIGFTHLIAPFRYDDNGLMLNDARAFSPSLGLTAKGRIDVDADRVDIEGTIVPAYFFNSMLGNLPIIGKLFSPEQGGGLFAARYSIRGNLNDPSVSVNPLSALTPGFLREIFGLF